MDEDKVLSAEEGADRVAERWRARRKDRKLNEVEEPSEVEEEGAESEEDEDSTPNYTCENCGAHVFLFLQTADWERTVRETLQCSCGETDTAAVREFLQKRTITSVGRLDAEHRVAWEDDEYGDETVDDEECEELSSDVHCEECVGEAGEGDWESDDAEEWEQDDESVYCEVRCAKCDHEVEFGWSHPDRGGRVWPCESADFSPWMTFPERRFVDAWQRRGWLRPPKRQRG